MMTIKRKPLATAMPISESAVYSRDKDEYPAPSHQLLPKDNQTGHDESSWITCLFRDWTLELACLILAAGAIIAILIILRQYDNQPIPSWSGGVTINALIAWMNTIALLSLISVAKSTIAQFKWIWFAQKHRPLGDFKAFIEADNAWGAAKLIVNINASHLAVITCIGMTLSIALEPFTQNLVRFYNDNVVDTKTAAWVTKGNWYNITGPQYMYRDYSPDPILKINIQNAISYLGQPNTVSNPAFSCPSGNCTFPTFTTLAYCASCTDISDRITRDCGSCNETSNYVCGYDPCNVQIRGSNLSIQYYPGGAGQSISYAADALKGKDALVYTNDTLPDHFPNVFQSLRAVQNQTLAREGTLSLRKDTKLVATECVLSPCIQGIKAIVERGVYKQTIIKLIQPAMIPYKAGYTAINLTLPEDRDLGLVNLTDRSFGIISQVLSSWSARDFPGKMLKGNVTTIDSLQGLMFSNDQTEAIFFANTSHRHCSTNESFACAIHATADAFTKTIRDAQFLVGGDTDLNLVMGSVMVNQTFVRVQWYWITLHIAIWLLTTIGWATAFYNTKKTGIPAWKGSPIPLLVLYREDTYGGEGPLIQTTSSGLYYNPKTMTTCLEDISNVNARLYGNNEGTIRLSIPISRQQTKS